MRLNLSSGMLSFATFYALLASEMLKIAKKFPRALPLDPTGFISWGLAPRTIDPRPSPGRCPWTPLGLYILLSIHADNIVILNYC